MEFFVAFLTGLTAGGLSCLAVQGGLLASSMARQMEENLASSKKRSKASPTAKPASARPILLFLAAKLIAYTLLGALLGALGSVFQLTLLTRAILLLVIGVFMIGNGLRMLNVHPFFRYFAIETPSFLTRYIRRVAKNDSDVTPLFLGALTVLIPCGVTQSMMALAIGSADPLFGAGILFAFTLGASPVFFGAAYLTFKLGSRLEANFMRFVAVVVLILGLITIDSGLNLMGAPSVSRAINQLRAPAGELASSETPPATELVVEARNEGYFPTLLRARAGEPVTLTLVTNETLSCSRAFVIPALNVEELLPGTGRVTFDIPPQAAGTKMKFTCSMGMYTGEIVFQ